MREKLTLRNNLQGWIWEARDTTLVGGLQRPAHTHQELELNLVISGQGRYLINGTRYDLAPGTLVWLFPGQPHVLAHYTADFAMTIAVFRPTLVTRLCRSGTASCLKKNRPGQVLIRSLDNQATQDLKTLCESIVKAAVDPAWFNAGIGFLLRQSWALFEATQSEPHCKLMHPAVTRAAGLLAGTTEARSLPTLSRQCGLSYSRLCRVFTEQMGMSLLEYRDRHRLDHYRRLYGDGQRRTMLDCAMEAGFGSYAQFHRVFKKLMATCPRDYRRRPSS